MFAQRYQNIVLLLWILLIAISYSLLYGAMIKRARKTNKVFWLRMAKWFSAACKAAVIIIVTAVIIISLLCIILLAAFPFVYKS